MVYVVVILFIAIIIYVVAKRQTVVRENISVTGLNYSNIIVSNLESFPDRSDAITHNKNALLKFMDAGDIGLANLSFAKLVESIRQQNVNAKGAFDGDLRHINEIYDLFREQYSVEYPKEFLPPKKRRADRTSRTSDVIHIEFEGPLYKGTPKNFIHLLDTIKTKAQWESLGFKIPKGRYSHRKEVRRNGLCFVFNEATRLEELKEKALATGKKFTKHPARIFEFIELGCTFDDFAAMSDDIKRYCDAMMQYNRGDLERAKANILESLKIKPGEHTYSELYYEICYEMKDTSVIPSHISYFIKAYGGISAMAHCEKIDRWVTLLCDLGYNAEAIALVDRVNGHFDEEIKGIDIFKKPVGVKYIVNGSESAGEELAKTEQKNKLEFAKSSKDKFNKRILNTLEKASSAIRSGN